MDLPKKERNSFDATWRGSRLGDDLRRRLCVNCLPKVLGEYFRAFSYRAVAIAPGGERAGYSFAPLEQRTNAFVWSDELEARVRDLLPPEGAACARCGAPAHFNWCGREIYDGSPFELRLRPRGTFPEQPLCGGCAAEAFESAFRAGGAVLREVLPPADGDGLLSTAEY